MDDPVRLILKKSKTDAHCQLIETEYRTIDIENKELALLLYKGSHNHGYGKFEVVGAELPNSEELLKKYETEMKNLAF